MTRFDSASRKPKSLARLIAEEAFSRPVPKPAANVPVVRVIGRKLSLKAPEAPVAEAPTPVVAEEPAHKPRVFVLRKAGDEAPVPEAQAVAAGPVRPVRARRRRVAAPVHVVYTAPERPLQPEPVLPVSLDGLAGSLAGIEPTLEMIRRAMAFDFSDPAIVAEWEELSRTAGQLSELIAA